MISKAPKLISEYLLVGMHHSTADAQEQIRLIIENEINEKIYKLAHARLSHLIPSEIALRIHHYKTAHNYQI